MILKKFLTLLSISVLLLLSACGENEPEVTGEAIATTETVTDDSLEEETLSPREAVDGTIKEIEKSIESMIRDGRINDNDFKLVDLENFLYEPKIEEGHNVNKMFVAAGTVEKSDYYNYYFSDYKETHQAYKLTDLDGNVIYIYGKRDSNNISEIDDYINTGNEILYFDLYEPYFADTGSDHMAEILTFASPFLSGNN